MATGAALTPALGHAATPVAVPVPPAPSTVATQLAAAEEVPEDEVPEDEVPEFEERSGTLVGHAIVDEVVVRTGPSDASSEVATLDHPRDHGGPLVFQGLGEPVDGWLQVRLPARPNGLTGWIRTTDVDITRNPYRIEVDVDDYELAIFRDDEVVLTTTVAIGTGSTPTPRGEFYLMELLRPPDPDGLYGPYAYGLSGFSNALTSFNGGPGIIGIHGTNEPDLLGRDVSHGCIRVDNGVITEMAGFLPLGTPISIAT